MSLFDLGAPPRGIGGDKLRAAFTLFNQILVYTGSGTPQPIILTDGGIEFPGTVKIGSGNGYAILNNGDVEALPYPATTPDVYTNPTLTLNEFGQIVAIESGTPSNITDGYGIDVTDPTIGNDLNLRKGTSLTVRTTGGNLNPGFTTAAAGFVKHYAISGQNSYGAGTNSKTTFEAGAETVEGCAQGQKFVHNLYMNGYGHGDTFAQNLDVRFAGGPIAGDEGQGIWSASYLLQQQYLTLLTLDTLVQSSGGATFTLTQSVVAGLNPQAVTVSSTAGLSVGTWISVDQVLDDQAGYPNVEAVQITAIGTGTISGVFKNNHNSGAVCGKALVITSTNGADSIGEGRLLVNLSGTTYSTGTVASKSGRNITFSGTNLTTNMVGGGSLNVGGIKFPADDISSPPFNGSGIHGTLHSYYPILAINSTTSLAVGSFTVSGDQEYRGNIVNGSTFVVYPAVRVLKVVGTNGTGSKTMVCQYTTTTWTVNDNLELAICPYPDCTGFQILLATYTPGAVCRDGFRITNNGPVQYQSAYNATGNFAQGFFAGNGPTWGAGLYGTTGAIITNFAENGQIQWDGGFLKPISATQGMTFFPFQGNSGGSGGMWQHAWPTWMIAHGLGADFSACYTGLFMLAGNGSDAEFRMGPTSTNPDYGFGRTHCFAGLPRHYSSGYFFATGDSVDHVYYGASGDVLIWVEGPRGLYVPQMYLTPTLAGSPLILASATPPISNTATGTKGTVIVDTPNSLLYLCTATDTWVRMSITTSWGSAPTVTSSSPSTDYESAARTLTITGTGFSGVTAVTIGGINAQWYQAISATSLRVLAYPINSAGAKDIAVTTGQGTGTGVGAITYSAATIGTTVSNNGWSGAQGIGPATLGPDDRVWFSGYDSFYVFDAGGTETTYSVSEAVNLIAPVVCKDGNLWSGDYGTFNLFRTTTSGTVTKFTLSNIGTEYVYGIGVGRDGPLVVAYDNANGDSYLWICATDGTATKYTYTDFSAYYVVQLPSGNIYIAGQDGAFSKPRLLVVDSSGTELSRHDLGLSSGSFSGLAVAHDGKLWAPVGGATGLLIIDPGNIDSPVSKTLPSGTNISNPLAAPDGKMWIAAGNQGANGTIRKYNLDGTTSANVTVTNAVSGGTIVGLSPTSDGKVVGGVFSSTANGFVFKVQ